MDEISRNEEILEQPGEAENIENAEEFYFDDNMKQVAYEEALEKLARVVHGKFSTLYGDVEKSTRMNLSRMNYVCVDDEILGALYEAEKEKDKAKLPHDKDGNLLEMLDETDDYMFDKVDTILAEALLQGRSITYFGADPTTAAAKGIPMSLKLADLGEEAIPEMTEEEVKAAVEVAEENRGEVRPAEELEQGIRDAHRNLLQLNYFDTMKQASLFSGRTKRDYFGAIEEETGITIADLDTQVQQKKGRGGVSALAVAELICRGYRIEDVLDPTKLLAEKDKAGRETVEHLLANDAEWVADTNLRARIIVGDDLVKRAGKVDFTDMKTLFSEANKTLFMEADLAFELGQNIDTDETKAEEKKWYENHCGDKTPEEFEKEIDGKAIVTAGFVQTITRNQEKLLQAEAGLTTNGMRSVISRDFMGQFFNQKLKENPGKTLDQLLTLEDGALQQSDSLLAVTSPQADREYKDRIKKDPRGFAKEILSGEFAKKYDFSIEMMDGAPMPALKPKPFAPAAQPVSEKRSDFANISEVIQESNLEDITEDLDFTDRTEPTAQKTAEKSAPLDIIEEAEEEAIDSDFGDRMEVYVREGIDNLTPQQKLEEIRRINEDLKAAGAKTMTEDEMYAMANDPQLVRDYYDAVEFCKKMDKTYEFQENSPYIIKPALQRSKGYLFDLSGTDEAKAANDRLAERLNTDEGVKEVLRGAFNMMMNFDESALFAKTLQEKINLFGDNPQKMQLLFELRHMLSETDKTSIFTPEELEQLNEKMVNFENVAGYEASIRVNASPLHLFMPQLSPEDTVKMNIYYSKNQPEKHDYINSYTCLIGEMTDEKYVPYAADILKENGFLGKQTANETYETYNEKNEKLSKRKDGMLALSDGSAQSIRFVKNTANWDGTVSQKELTVKRSDLLMRYGREQLDNQMNEIYKPLSKVEFTSDPEMQKLQEEALSRGITPKKMVFSTDPLIRDAQKAILIQNLRMDSEFAEADPIRKEQLYNQYAGELMEDKSELLRFLRSQPREVMEKMVSELASPDSATRYHVLACFNAKNAAEKDLAMKNDPAGDFVRGMFLPQTDSSAMRSNFHSLFMGGHYVSSQHISAQKAADDIVLPVPAGLTDNNVAAVAMACFMTPENMKKSYELSMKDTNTGSTLKGYFDTEMGGLGNLIENVFSKNDQRENLHTARLALPEAREKAKELLEKYQKGDYAELVSVADKTLRFVTSEYKSFQGRNNNNYIICGRIATDLCDLLSRPEIKNKYKTILDEEPETFKLIRTDLKIAREKAELRNDIVSAVQQKVIEKEYLGKNPDETAKLADDAALREKILDYTARKLYLDRSYAANKTFDGAANLKFGAGEEVREVLKNRPLSRIQKNMIAHPDEYIDYLKERIRSGKEPLYAKMYNAQTWKAASEEANADRVNARDTNTHNISYAEKWGLATKVSQFLAQTEDEKKFKALNEKLNALPCMTDDDEEEVFDLTSDEMLRRAEIYEDIVNSVRGTEVRHFTENANGFMGVTDASEELARALTDEAKLLRDNAVFAKEEREYEREATRRELRERGLGDLSFEEAKKRVEEGKAAYEDEIAKYISPDAGKIALRYGRATKSSYLSRIIDLVNNAPQDIAYCDEFTAVSHVMEAYANLKMAGSRAMTSTYEETFEETCQSLEDLTDKMNAKLINDDSQTLMNKVSYITNLTALAQAYHDTPELSPEAEELDSAFEKTYADTFKREKEIERRIRGINAEESPELLKLAKLAKGSLARVREAVANEAYGKQNEGVASLRASDDLAILSMYSTIVNSPADSRIRSILERDGANACIRATDNSKEFAGSKKSLSLDNVSRALASPNGFTGFMASGAGKRGPEAGKQNEPRISNPEFRLSK